MEFVDEDGRLFGTVNVIDVLVVVAAVAAVALGVALVGGVGEETEPQQTRYATLVFSDIPPSAAEGLQEGHTFSVADSRGAPTLEEGTPRVNITDVVVTGGPNGTAVAVARAQVTAATAADTDRIALGTTAQLGDSRYGYNVTVAELNRSTSTLVTDETPAFVTTTVPAPVADRVDTNTTFTVGTRQVGAVESVGVVPTRNPDTVRLRLGVVLRTVRLGGVPTFAGVPVQYNATLPLRNDDVRLPVAVENVGATAPPGEARTTSITARWSNVDPARADAIERGAKSAHRGGDARVTAVETRPAQVLVTTADGEVRQRDHPTNETVTLTVDIDARVTERGLVFHGRRVTIGRPVVLEFPTVTVEGRVTALGT